MAIDMRPSGALLVTETGQAELAVALSPDADLVVMHADRVSDVPVRPAVGRQEHDDRARWATRASTVPERKIASSCARSPRRSFRGSSLMTTAKHITVINAADGHQYRWLESTPGYRTSDDAS